MNGSVAANFVVLAALAAPAGAENMRGNDQRKDRPGQPWHDGGHETRGEDWQRSWVRTAPVPPVVYASPDYVPPPVVYDPPADPGIAVKRR